ncbi:MAG: GntR family transcriptional regulator [Bdellovibrio sp.]|nr:GntR family transcriptional regulator [Bdellovibrio sp.]
MEQAPTVQIEDFALLRVVSVTPIGAFLDWDQPKDLFLPFSEQTQELQEGDDVVVKVYLDNMDRPCASMRLERHLDKGPVSYKENEAVQLMIATETELGFKAIINNQHIGLLYKNEIFQPLYVGDIVQGFIRKLREDKKIDLILRQAGHKATGDIGEKIIELLKSGNGFLAINDKTPPEKIYDLFGVSKKKYKVALGGLYKKKLITVADDGIHLVK